MACHPALALCSADFCTKARLRNPRLCIETHPEATSIRRLAIEQMDMTEKPYERLIRFSESFFDRHGDSYLGVGWTKRQEDADARYRVMLELIDRSDDEPVTLLDFGCGASHLYEYLLAHPGKNITYSGLDLSPKFLSVSRQKYPHLEFFEVDILEENQLPSFDYVIMNGIFNSKCDLSFEEMFHYFQQLVGRVFEHCRIGLAFNVMSKQVDWERDDLFYLPFDLVAEFLSREIGRKFVFRHDYGLFEYTIYVYRDPC
jgi:SAM-dependent methyltransferase